jgi:hypothetical protein
VTGGSSAVLVLGRLDLLDLPDLDLHYLHLLPASCTPSAVSIRHAANRPPTSR